MANIGNPQFFTLATVTSLLAVCAILLGCQERSTVNQTPQMAANQRQLDALSDQWRRESEQYVSAINSFVRRGIATNWEGMTDSDEPKDTRQPLANRVIEVVRSANESGEVDGLREKFPPDYSPFLELISKNGQDLPTVFLIDDDQIVVRVGPLYQSGYVAMIEGTALRRLPSSVITVGRSPNRKYFAIAEEGGVTIHEGWDGPASARLPWPTGIEGVPQQFKVDRIKGCPTITRLAPFDSGTKALLVSPEGIFVLETEKAVRLLPTPDDMRQHFEMLQKEFPNEPLSYYLDMAHGALSPDGKWIACGHQSSSHYVFDANSLRPVAEVGNLSEYPHYAIFSSDAKYGSSE